MSPQEATQPGLKRRLWQKLVSGLCPGPSNPLRLEKRGKERNQHTLGTYCVPAVAISPGPRVSPGCWQLLTHYTAGETEVQSKEGTCSMWKTCRSVLFSVVGKLQEGVGVECHPSARRGSESKLPSCPLSEPLGDCK